MVFKEIIIQKKGLKFLNVLINKIDKINQNGGYAYITENTIRLQSKPNLLYNHRFEFNLKDSCLINYYFSKDGFKTFTYDKFIEKLEELCKIF
jgi:hypothetical protein